MNRRTFVTRAALLAGLPALTACEQVLRWGVPMSVQRPGMAEGHRLRGILTPPTPQSERRCRVAVVGSGVAGLFAAWRLRQAGWEDVLVLNGPEPDGNASAGNFSGEFGTWPYPTGAHYLPLPSPESTHVRGLLQDMSVLEGGTLAKPRYAETTLVHSPAERLWRQGRWQEGLLPREGIPAAEVAEQQRFFALIEQLKTTRGADGRRVFTVPLALASHDPVWTALDQQTFATWLTAQGFRAPSLLWYLDYCCRDDYGTRLANTSAWAGLHFFAARRGQAENAEDGAVLTWPNGLNPLVQHLRSGIGAARQLPGMAWRVQPAGREVRVEYLDATGAHHLRAERVILATPLHISQHLFPDIRHWGFDPQRHQPPRAPWLVGNFLLNGFPPEDAPSALAWDNVVYGSASLGYVASTHQLIRAAKPTHTVFTTYHAYADAPPQQVRAELEHASAETLFDQASQDLTAVYGWRLRRQLKQVALTVRGHAMASPAPGFLSNTGLQALRAADGRVLFAHSDMSGLSVFEEAAWWGEQAALKILGGG